MTAQLVKPELMSPAGGWPQLQTAIEAGADAVYFGLNHFSARAKVGFSLVELPKVMIALHERGVKGFVTFNTLIFDHELDEARRVIDVIAAANVDAVIVQDVGFAREIAEHCPQLDVHGSTQMSITSAQGAAFASQLGCSRVVLGRELSLADIERIRVRLNEMNCDVELESFVHGALCVSYSGQCFSSEAWGGRSANRGQCAQACRLSYDLIVDGDQRDLGEFRYLLSPGDLYALEQVPELMRIGISCLKIEGRYKDADYVAVTTRAYRQAIDDAWEHRPHEIEPTELLQIEQAYSRGLGSHFIGGTNHQTVVHGRAPRHRGVLVGEVTHVGRDSVEVELNARKEIEIRRGDGLVFDAAQRRSPDEPEEGGYVFECKSLPTGLRRLEFRRESMKFDRIKPGDLVWRTHDPQLSASLSDLTKPSDPVHKRPLNLKVIARLNEPLRIEAMIDDDVRATYDGKLKITPSKTTPFTRKRAIAQLSRLGGTPFHLGKLVFECDDMVFVPASELNAARRDLMDKLLQQRGTRKPESNLGSSKKKLFQRPTIDREIAASPQINESSNNVELHLLVRSADQLDGAIQSKPSSITLDYLELYGLRPSVEKVQEADIDCRVASPRILKPAEQNIVRFLLSLKCGILVRSSGLLDDLIKSDVELPELFGDFSLNVSNQFSLQLYRSLGLTRITPSHDLNAAQIALLTEHEQADSLELIAFQHLPVFHTEHCVFCRFLSEGTDNTNCGHPCENHRVALRDHSGRSHPVLADVGCRNTVFNAEPQIAAKHLSTWRAKQLHHFRLEFVFQSSEDILAITEAHKDFFDRRSNASELRNKLESIGNDKTTEGSLYVPDDFQNLYEIR